MSLETLVKSWQLLQLNIRLIWSTKVQFLVMRSYFQSLACWRGMKHNFGRGIVLQGTRPSEVRKFYEKLPPCRNKEAINLRSLFNVFVEVQ